MFFIITVILCVCNGGRDEGGDRGYGDGGSDGGFLFLELLSI